MSIFACACSSSHRPHLPIAPPSSPEDLCAQGIVLFRRGLNNPEALFEARALFTQAERQRNIESCYQLGELSEHEGKEGEAKGWYEKAAPHHLKANLKYGLKIESEFPGKAYGHFIQGACKGCSESKLHAGRMLYESPAIPQDLMLATFFLTQAAQEGHSLANYYLGKMHLFGEIRFEHQDSSEKPNILKGVNLIRNSAQLDCEKAHSLLLEIYNGDEAQCSDFLNFNQTEEYLYQIGAVILRKNAHNPNACFALADQYNHGQGLQRKIRKIVKWYKKASDLGHIEASFLLGTIYFEGQEVQQNFVQAMKMFQRCHNKHDVRGTYYLARMHQEGLIIDKDPAQALALYREASEQGHLEARLFMVDVHIRNYSFLDASLLLHKILDFDPSIVKAKDKLPELFELTKKMYEAKINEEDNLAALRNIGEYYLEAQLYLGELYFEKKDYIESAQFYIKTFGNPATADKIEELFRIAYKYFNDGDKDKALRIFHHLSQEKLEAQLFLGELYLEGIEVSQNDERAAFYFGKAALRQNPYAIERFNFLYAKIKIKASAQEINMRPPREEKKE